MSSAFSLILNSILTCQHIFLSEGRKTKISLKDNEIDDGKGMHFSFPEPRMWIYALILTVTFIIPMKLWYPYIVSLLLWLIIIYLNTIKPFLHIMEITNMSFWKTFIKCCKIANTMFEIPTFEEKH